LATARSAVDQLVGLGFALGHDERVQLNLPIAHSQIRAGKLGPAAAVVVVDGAGRVGGGLVGVTAADDVAAFAAGVGDRLIADLLHAPQERLGAALGHPGDGVGAVDLLQ
jgi:hypothetical protein